MSSGYGGGEKQVRLRSVASGYGAISMSKEIMAHRFALWLQVTVEKRSGTVSLCGFRLRWYS